MIIYQLLTALMSEFKEFKVSVNFQIIDYDRPLRSYRIGKVRGLGLLDGVTLHVDLLLYDFNPINTN